MYVKRKFIFSWCEMRFCVYYVCLRKGRWALNKIKYHKLIRKISFLKAIHNKLFSAEFFKKYMNPTVDPCDDFYQFVCGNYLKNVPIPQDKGVITHFHTIGDKIRNQLISQLKSTIKPFDLKAFKNVKTHYQDCLNEGI